MVSGGMYESVRGERTLVDLRGVDESIVSGEANRCYYCFEECWGEVEFGGGL